MILTVTPNPALDVTISLDALRLGASHRVDPGHRRAGGKGVNVARVLNGQGTPARVIACVNPGDPAGVEFATDLDTAGIPLQLVGTSAPLRSSVTVVERSPGRATVLNERGRHPGEDAVRELIALVVDTPDAPCVVISGSLPEEMTPETVTELVSAAQTGNTPVVVDGSGAVLLAAAEAGASLLKPNSEELRSAVPGASGPLAAARELIARGAGTIVVTLGAAGMIRVSRGGALASRLPRALRGNPTGAGDAATAALAAGIARGGDLDEDALRRAVAWSASAVLAPVAGELDPIWQDLLDEVVIQEIVGGGDLQWSS